MNIDKTIDDFRRDAIDLDCKNIVISQRQEGGERYKGPGYIRQSKDGALIFKIYVIKSENAKPLCHLNALLNAAPGKLHTDDMFYDLEAVGRDETRWFAARIIPVMNWDMTDGSVLITGQMQSITGNLNLPQRWHYLRLHFFEEYDVPLRLMSRTEEHGNECMVLDRAEFEACGSKFEVRRRKGSGDTIIELTAEAAFPLAFHLRIQEALQYITGRIAIWRVRLESEGSKLVIELASPWRKSGRAKLRPPISPAFIGFLEHGWRLFACYLTYVVEKTDGTYWNPVAYHLHNACESSANSVDAWAVGVSVAAEAVASLIKCPGDDTKAKRLALFQDRMRECLATQTDFAELVPRMKGSIDAMSNKRPQDTMYSLAEEGYVEKAYVDAWTYLRNRHVHPTLKDLQKPDPIDNQKLLDNIHRVEVLLRQLTFYLIGYEGPFTDYGAETFQSKQYPLTRAGPEDWCGVQGTAAADGDA
jgi:hypothetical protein